MNRTSRRDRFISKAQRIFASAHPAQNMVGVIADAMEWAWNARDEMELAWNARDEEVKLVDIEIALEKCEGDIDYFKSVFALKACAGKETHE
jgi:hypothetical protein